MPVPISNVTRRVVYAPSGTGGAGPYAFTFEILANTDIAVYKDDTLLTLTTHYTVTINANGTGSVTITAAGLALAPVSPTQYAIVGNRTIARSTDFTTGGDFFANTLNDEIDQQTIFAQQNAEGLSRALQAPQTDPTSINMTLPRRADRANKFLAFNSVGDPVPGETPAELTSVYNNIGYIQTIGADLAGTGFSYDLGNVSDAATGVPAATPDGHIVAVYNALDDIAALQDDTANIATVAGIAANVTTVAGISANVTAVAADATDIGVVSGISSSVTTLAPISANITTVASISGNVTTVAGISANVTTVAGISANVTSVAGIAANVTTVATNIVDIQNAEENADAAIAAQAAAESARDATLAAFDSFDDRYLGSKASNPTLDNDGNALVSGALYFNSTDGVMKVYTGSAWVAAYASLSGALLVTNNLSDLTSAVSARSNLGLGSIATQDASSVTITGGSVNGTTIGASNAAAGTFTDLTVTGTLDCGSIV